MARPLHVAFGEAVRRVRRQKGFSQEELGRLSGLHRNHVGEIERGETNPTLESVEVISEALNVRASALIELAESLRS